MTKVASLTIVYNDDTDQFCMIKRHKDGETGFPCGKVEEWETIQDGAIRELEEETGITLLDLHGAPQEIGRAMMDDCLVFVFGVNTRGNIKLIEREEGVPFWATPEEIRDTQGRFADFNRKALEIFYVNM